MEVDVPAWYERQLYHFIADGRPAVAVDPSQLAEYDRLAKIRVVH